jgi:long-subunit fatty acid transport protein
MTRQTLLLIAVLCSGLVYAQGVNDALRYGLDNTTGSARYHAMSGAFGALGGELTSMAINPAGSAVFLTNEMSFSMGVFDRTNKSNYFGTSQRAIDTDASLNQAGGVFVFNNYTNSNWKKFTIGLNYNNTSNLDDDLYIRGQGNTSIGQYFVERAQGTPLELLQLLGGETISELYRFLGESQGTAAQDAMLGYQGFIIDPLNPDDPGNTGYVSNIAPGRFNQEYFRSSRGFNGKYTLNFGAQYGENIYVGMNLNAHSIDFRESVFLLENNSNPGSLVNRVGFDNNLSVIGNGFSAQFGIIGKVGNSVRLGLTYDTPTWFDISEQTTQYLETRRNEGGNTITTVVNPNVVNVFADYQLRTPGRLGLSAAYVFGNQGLISVDYAYRDFSSTRFRSNFSGEFSPLNNTIDDVLGGSSSIRVGGEYRLSELSFRGGWRYDESPYKDSSTFGNLNSLSMGLGYNFGNYNFGISYAYSERERNQQLYGVGLTSTANVNAITNEFIFTLGFIF